MAPGCHARFRVPQLAMAPRWLDWAFAALFFVVLPRLAYLGWGGWPLRGWPGVVLYALAGLALIATIRSVSCRVRGVSFWTWE